jgi:hypothetical protein
LNAAFFAVIGAVAGGLITAVTTAAISYYQRHSSMREAHRVHAFERHLEAYERIFVTVRSVLDALNDYELISARVANSPDSVLEQLLDILNNCAYQYCTAVDWRYNASMAYLDLRLEERCLKLRDLLLRWLSGQRLATGDILSVYRNDEAEEISARRARALRIGDYQELSIEKITTVTDAPGDARLKRNIRRTATSVIKHLKDVMAY